MKENWLRLFCIFSFSIFLISVIAYLRVNWWRSIASTKGLITGKVNNLDPQNTVASGQRKSAVSPERRASRPKITMRSNQPETSQSHGDFLSKEDTDQSGNGFDGVSQTQVGPLTPGVSETQVDPSTPSEHELRIVEIKESVKWLSKEIKQLDEEEATLPPRRPIEERRMNPSTTFFTREEMERENEIAARRREIRLKSVELSTELFYLRRELKELQQEQ